MDWSGSDHAESFGLFRQKMELYLEDEDITETAAQARKICRGLGDEGLRRLNASGLKTADKKKPSELWKFFESHLRLNVNFRIHRLQLMQYRQRANEMLDDFVTRARTLALKCDFSDDELAERMMELIIAGTPHDAFRKELLGKPKGHTLASVLTEGRQHEALTAGDAQVKSLAGQAGNIDAVRKQYKQQQRQCRNCGLNHAPRKCPAHGDTCRACGKLNHWAKFCQQRSQNRPKMHNERPKTHKPRKKKHISFNAVDMDSEDEDEYTEAGATYYKQFFSVTVSDKFLDSISTGREEAYTSLQIQPPGLEPGNYSIRLKIDTGAAGNTLPLRTMQQMYGSSALNHKSLKPNNGVKLTAYNGQQIPCHGSIELECKHGNMEWTKAMFYVVDVPGPPIIGLPTSEQLKLVTINVGAVTKKKPTNNTNDLKDGWPLCSNRPFGDMPGDADLYAKENAESFIDPPRKWSIHMLEKLKAEIDRMENIGVLQKVTEHSDWCSSMTYSVKRDGSLRVCIDPKHLNDALKRCPHKIPTVEEISPRLAGAKFFTKLDAKAGYWSVRLTEDAQKLTTFRTPFGRYRFRRLPFGLKVSQDIFQAKMDTFLEGLDRVLNISDDIIVVGNTEEEHDQNLALLMDKAEANGVVFNIDKCLVKQKSVTFFGNQYSNEGVRPDPEKVRDIQKMPTPQNKEELHSFIGLMQYLSQFTPNFADRAHHLRELLKQDVPWVWEPSHQKCFEELKTAVTKPICLKYYDTTKSLSLEVDASQKGLGAALVQDGKPIAFGSKTLTECQSRYSNIEREMLAVVWGIERYHTYLYGRAFTVVSDHKPLEIICGKPLRSAPPRLQRMLTKIQGYDFKVTYRPGKDMLLADTLSRLPNPDNNEEVQLDLKVDAVTGPQDDEIELALINFSTQKRKALVEETQKDPVLRELMSIIYMGWPDSIKQLPTDLRPYWSARDELVVEAGVVCKGRRVVVPKTLQQNILAQLHEGHQGIEKTRGLARESIYWPNINDHITKMCKSCDTCQTFQPSNQKEPLIGHEIPSRPWQSISTDLFETNKKTYLLIIDRYSHFPIMEELRSESSTAITHAMKSVCAIFGRPDEIMSDNGPGYVGSAIREFTESWGIDHVTSSPRYPRSNGYAERSVQHVKTLVKKALHSGQDIHRVLLNIRATPVDAKLKSPAELMFGRPIATCLPSRAEPGPEHIREQLHLRRDHMISYHDKSAQRTELPPLYVGQAVRILDKQSKTWCPGTVQAKCKEPRSYIVDTPNGTQLRRNRSMLREMQPTTTPKFQLHEVEEAAAEIPTPTPTPAAPPEQTAAKVPNHGKTTRSGRNVVTPRRYRTY